VNAVLIISLWGLASAVLALILGPAIRRADERDRAAAARRTGRPAPPRPATSSKSGRPPGPLAALVIAVVLVVAVGLTIGGAPILDWAVALRGAR
jgi:hypothetical protein